MKKISLPKNQKEERICDLIKQRKNVREIAADQHVSFSEIKRIREKYFEKDDGDLPQNSKRSQALKFFEEGKSDLEIAIELDLSSKEILGYRHEHLTLKAEDNLLAVYRTVGAANIEPFVKLYEMMREQEVSPDDALWALEEYGSFENIEKEFTSLTKRLRVLREEVGKAETQKQVLIRENTELSESNFQLRSQQQTYHDQMKSMQVKKMMQDKISEIFHFRIDNDTDLSWLAKEMFKD
jgi:hypothetical protein